MSSRVDKRVLPLFLIHLVKKQSSKNILDVRELFKIRVQIENYRAPHKAVQCWNCQGFFHISTYCFMDPKCVGCGGAHKSPECPRKTEILDEIVEEIVKPPPSCCNCGSQHPASFKGCEKFPLKPKYRKTYAEITQNTQNQPKIVKPTNNDRKTKIRELKLERLKLEKKRKLIR